jgi:hypothetical protein
MRQPGEGLDDPHALADNFRHNRHANSSPELGGCAASADMILLLPKSLKSWEITGKFRRRRWPP